MSAETRRHCRPHYFESDERLETCAALPSANEVVPLLSEIRRTKSDETEEDKTNKRKTTNPTRTSLTTSGAWRQVFQWSRSTTW